MRLKLGINRAAAFLLTCVAAFAQNSGSERAAWNKPFPPFRIAGELYYVGAAGVSSFLIHTSEGSIVIDGGLEETAPQIERNIAALGFRVSDVKYLLNSHAHYDHCGGLAELKRASGARVVASRGDSEALRTGHEPSFGPDREMVTRPVAVDRVIDEGATVQLGGITLTAHITPGHTPGCTTWTMPLKVGGRELQVVFYCSTSVPGWKLVNNEKYPRIVEDYRKSFSILRALPCDVFLGPHPGFFHMEEKRARMTDGGPNPFVKPGELQAFVAESEAAFNRELRKQERYTR